MAKQHDPKAVKARLTASQAEAPAPARKTLTGD